MSSVPESKPLMIVRWVSKLAVIGIFTVVGWLPKFTGQAGPLVDKLQGFGGQRAVYAIGVAEAVAIILLLIPKTAVIGAVLAVMLMVGAIGSHLGPVGLEGDFFGVFIMAIVALLAAGATGTLEAKKRYLHTTTPD